MARTPECRMADDGRHFLWSHECVSPEYNDADGTVAIVAKWFADEMLPLNDQRGWRVDQVEPLTISPSIHCLNCGTHGFWRAGRWVPA